MPAALVSAGARMVAQRLESVAIVFGATMIDRQGNPLVDTSLAGDGVESAGWFAVFNRQRNSRGIGRLCRIRAREEIDASHEVRGQRRNDEDSSTRFLHGQS